MFLDTNLPPTHAGTWFLPRAGTGPRVGAFCSCDHSVATSSGDGSQWVQGWEVLGALSALAEVSLKNMWLVHGRCRATSHPCPWGGYSAVSIESKPGENGGTGWGGGGVKGNPTDTSADTSKAPRTASFPPYPEQRAEHPRAVAKPRAEGTCGTLTANCCLPLLSYPGLSLQHGAVVAPPPDGRDEVVGLPPCLAAWPAPAPELPPSPQP